MMNSIQLRQAKAQLISRHAILREPGVLIPDKKGRKIAEEEDIIKFFHFKQSPYVLFAMLRNVTGKKLDQIFDDENFTPDERPHIVRQHIDFAHAAVKQQNLPEDVNIRSAKLFTQTHGKRLRDVAQRPDATLSNWVDYAAWLSSRAAKVKATNPASSGRFKQHEEFWIRKAHAEANTNLADILYSERDKTKEAIALWEKAAADGNERALTHLFDVLCADDSLKMREKKVSLAKADGKLLSKLFNTLQNKPDPTPYDTECKMLVSEAIDLKEEMDKTAAQSVTGASHSGAAPIGNPRVPA